MKDYLNFNALELAQDDQFLKWVKHPGQYPEIDLFWQTWREVHPEKEYEISEAMNLIQAISREGEFQGVEKLEVVVWEKLQRSIDQYEKPATDRVLYFTPFKIAASLLIMAALSAGVWWILKSSSNTKQSPIAETNFIKEINNGSQPKTIVLGDGTIIHLEPRSSLFYPEVFADGYREVKLNGEAFFDVARDPQKPFVVHAGQLVTKVLGTSFTIRAFQDEKKVLVKVRSGKVSVSKEPDGKNRGSLGNDPMNGVLLSPNQQVIYALDDARLVKSLVENPILLNPSPNQRFEFKNTPLSEVFTILEEAYGIEILYDKEVMADCALNASLINMSLFDKMRLICKGANAQYEILDSHIVITGKGCK
ncbi:MAG: FecR family protein [Cyclobacteriaceae bacterium]|nr:FecR family protein [Cyclobacteriaceae bacterium]